MTSFQLSLALTYCGVPQLVCRATDRNHRVTAGRPPCVQERSRLFQKHDQLVSPNDTSVHGEHLARVRACALSALTAQELNMDY